MLSFIQSTAHYIIGLAVIACTTILATTGHISGNDALGVFAGIAGVAFTSGAAATPTSTTTTNITAPKNN